MRTIAVLFATLMICAFTACSDTVNAQSQDSADVDSTVTMKSDSGIGGIYAFGTNSEVEAVGSVFIYPETDSTFLFYIDFNRGAPSYNMAILAERGVIVGDTGIYYADFPDTDQSCKIKFYFRKNFVQIENSQRDCGFGANCMIDHVYERRGNMIPQFYVGPEGDTVYFSNLSKEL